MFHDCHQLDCVVPKITDSRKRIGSELLVGSDSELRSRNSDVGFINTKTVGGRWARILELVPFRFGRIPETSFVNRRDTQILSDPLHPSRDTFNTLARGQNKRYLEQSSDSKYDSFDELGCIYLDF